MKSRRAWKVYVSGPITAANQWLQEQNIRRAEAVTVELVKMGVTPICVHSMGRFMDGICTHDEWMEMDLEILRVCDALVLSTTDYSASKGTLREVDEARALGLPVFGSAWAFQLYLEKLERAA